MDAESLSSSSTRIWMKKRIALLQELSSSLGPGDWAVVAQCLTELDEADKVAELLMRLVDGCNGVGNDALLALQIAFDLFDDDVQARSPRPPQACVA